MIMMVKTPGSQMGSPAAAEEEGEEVGGGRWESGERSEVQARSTLASTAPKARPGFFPHWWLSYNKLFYLSKNIDVRLDEKGCVTVFRQKSLKRLEGEEKALGAF